MKQVFSDKIINIDGNLYDNRFLFKVATNIISDREIDLSKELSFHKNENLEYKKDYKLWSEVYSPKIELELFRSIFDDALKSGKKMHISNISLAEEIDLVKKLYLDLGYFNEELNCFVLDFENAPISI